MKARYEDEDDDGNFDADDIMRKNGTFRVPVTMMDGMQRDIAGGLSAGAMARAKWIEETCNTWQRREATPPAPPQSAPASGDAAKDAYDDYVRRLGNRWMTP
jgi:hypothetical protein